MTRFLSEVLEAPEPMFRLGLQHLEKASQHPNTDIRFSTEVMQASKAKLRELGLDKHDTTAEELYHALEARVAADDKRLERKLRTLAATHISAEADVNDGMLKMLADVASESPAAYGMKTSVLKSLLKKQQPKKAMKQLGYRSLDSMLKHEPATQVLAAAWLTEATAWRQRFMEQYRKLQPSDFESRKLIIEQPRAARWAKLTAKALEDTRHTVLSFKELGALIVLPIPSHAPQGSVTATASLALHELNEIKAGSTFLKLCQVRGDFGVIVQTVALAQPQLSAHQLDQSVPWHIIQRFYARMEHLFSEELFAPHIDLSDMHWHSVEELLAKIEPSFEFWQSTPHLGFLHAGQAVSMNLVDAALNYCNDLPFEHRVRSSFQQSMWHELLMRYLQPATVEQTVLAQLQPAYAKQAIMA